MAPPRQLRNNLVSYRNDPWLPQYTHIIDPGEFDSILREEGWRGIQGMRGYRYDLLDIYSDLERDAHLFATLQSRKMDVVRREWEVTPASTRRKDKRNAEMVTEMLKALSANSQEEESGEALITTGTGFDTVAYGMLNALLMGYQPGEVMWAGKQEVIPAEIRIRDARRFGFAMGDNGWRPRLRTRTNLYDGQPVPPRKIIFHHHQIEHGPYGLGLGYRLFWPVFFKREDLKFWLIFVEKFASPTAIATYPTHASKEDRDVLMEALDAISQETGIGLPEGTAIELLEAQRSGSINCYKDLADWCDQQISKAVLGQTGTTDQSGGGGSRARDEVAERVSVKLAKYDADLLAGTLNRTLVRWIMHFNVGPDAPSPQLWWKFPELEAQDDLNARANRDKVLVDIAGRKLTDKYLIETYDVEFDEPEPDQQGLLAGLFGSGGATAGSAAPDGEGEDVPVEEAPPTEPTPANDGQGAAADAAIVEEPDAPELREPTPPANLAESREKDLADRTTDRAARQIHPVLQDWEAILSAAVDNARSFDDLLQQIPQLYGDLDPTLLAEVLGQGMAIADAAGRYEVLQEEDPDDLPGFGEAIGALQRIDLIGIEAEITMPIDFEELTTTPAVLQEIGRRYVEALRQQQAIDLARLKIAGNTKKSKLCKKGQVCGASCIPKLNKDGPVRKCHKKPNTEQSFATRYVKEKALKKTGEAKPKATPTAKAKASEPAAPKADATPTLKAKKYNPDAIPNLSATDFRAYLRDRDFLTLQNSSDEPHNQSRAESGLSATAFKIQIANSLKAGYVPSEQAIADARLNKKQLAEVEANRKALAEREANVQRIRRAIDAPMVTDEDTKGYKPTMTPEEGAAYAAGSFFGATNFYHGNRTEITDSVATEGAQPNRNRRGIYGMGFYLGVAKETGQVYAGQADGESSILTTVAKVKNPYVADRASLSELGGNFLGSQSNGVDSVALNEFLRAKGYDSIYLKDQGYVIAFDQRQVAVVNNERVTSEQKERYRNSDAAMDLTAEAQIVERMDTGGRFRQLDNSESVDYVNQQADPEDEDDFGDF